MFSFFRLDRNAVTVLSKVTEFPRQVTNEYTSLSMYDVTLAQQQGQGGNNLTSTTSPIEQ